MPSKASSPCAPPFRSAGFDAPGLFFFALSLLRDFVAGFSPKGGGWLLSRDKLEKRDALRKSAGAGAGENDRQVASLSTILMRFGSLTPTISRLPYLAIFPTALILFPMYL